MGMRRTKRISKRSVFTRECIRLIRKLPIIPHGEFVVLAKKAMTHPSRWQAPDGYGCIKYQVEKASIELLQKAGRKHKHVILQLHGGAYIAGMMDLYRDLAVQYSKMAMDADVATLDYRVAPKYKHPAALIDALLAWEFLIKMGYHEENIIVAGDSAGGNLALALVTMLRDQNRKLPAGIFVMSPWADLAETGESVERNLYKDPIFGKVPGEKRKMGEHLVDCSYAGKANLKDAYLSPVYADYHGFPPMLLQTGTYEILESDSERIYYSAKQAGVQVQLTKYRGMFHVFQLGYRILPEAKLAWREAAQFFDEVWSER
ncbi:MAG: alpha/beta hydrolase [Lachnospiraceae bacterium]|nr:alpha/beta hydrolase [Lachnospiraceae bacterium]